PTTRITVHVPGVCGSARTLRSTSVEQTNHNFLNGGGQAGISDRMRDLLSQAAQEHTSEQKSQGAVNEEMRQRLEGMEWLLRELREHELTALAESVTTVQGRIDDFLARPPQWAETLAEHIEIVGQQVKPLADMPSLRADTHRIAGHLDTALTRLQRMAETGTKTAEQVETLGDRLTGLSETVATRLTSLDEAVAALSERTEAVEATLNTLSESSGERHEALTETLAQNRTEITESLTSGKDELAAAVKEGREALATALTEARDALSATGKELGAEGTGKLDTAAAELRAFVEEHTSEQHSALLERLQENTGELGERTTKLAEELETLSTAAKERHETLHSELTDRAGAAEQRHDKLAASVDDLGTLAEENHAETTAAVADLTGSLAKVRQTHESSLNELRTHLRQRLSEVTEQMELSRTESREQDEATAERLRETLTERTE